MQEAYDIRNRTFSFGAHGYNQDEVDRYMRELADRVDAGDVDWSSEADRLAAELVHGRVARLLAARRRLVHDGAPRVDGANARASAR